MDSYQVGAFVRFMVNVFYLVLQMLTYRSVTGTRLGASAAPVAFRSH